MVIQVQRRKQISLTRKRIADFVREHRTDCIEMFTDAINSSEERIDAIIGGGEPTVENGWKEFDLDCDGQIITMKVKPKVFNKLEQAQESYPMWVAAIAGKRGLSIIRTETYALALGSRCTN